MLYEMEKEQELRDKIIAQTKPADFEQFWDAAIAQLRAIPIAVKREKWIRPIPVR